MSSAYFLFYSRKDKFSDNSFAVFCQLASELLLNWYKKYKDIVPSLLNFDKSHPFHNQWIEHNRKVLKIFQDGRPDSWKVAALKGLWYINDGFLLYTAISGPIRVPHNVDAYDCPDSICITYSNSPVDELCAAIFKIAARFSSALTYKRQGNASESCFGEELADSICIRKLNTPVMDPFGEFTAYGKAEWRKANALVC